MAVRGIIGAFSRNVKQDLIPDDVAMDWYDNIHIPDVISTSGIKTALRYEAVDPKARFCWLVIYPTNDINFAKTDEFDKIPKGGHKELDGRMFTDLVDMDLRISARTQVFDAPGAKKGRTAFLLAESISVADDQAEGFNKWYTSEFLPALTKLPTFRRATRYTVVQSLDAVWPKHLAFLEFESVDIPVAEVQKLRATAAAKQALGSATVDDVVYKLAKEAGVTDETL